MLILQFQNQRCSAVVVESTPDDAKLSQNKEANRYATEKITGKTPHTLCQTTTNIPPVGEYPCQKRANCTRAGQLNSGGGKPLSLPAC